MDVTEWPDDQIPDTLTVIRTYKGMGSTRDILLKGMLLTVQNKHSICESTQCFAHSKYSASFMFTVCILNSIKNYVIFFNILIKILHYLTSSHQICIIICVI